MLKPTGSANAILTEGMGGRLKTRNGGITPLLSRRSKRTGHQLVPLKNRKNAHQLAKRTVKIAARRTVAEQLVMAQRALAFELYRRTLRGRFNVALARVRRMFTRQAA